MQVEIKRVDGCYTLEVNGVSLIDRESFAVVDNVARKLRAPEEWDHSESQSVADAIRDWLVS